MSVLPEKEIKETQRQPAKSKPSIFLRVKIRVARLFRRLRTPSKAKGEFFYHHEEMNVKTSEDHKADAERRGHFGGGLGR